MTPESMLATGETTIEGDHWSNIPEVLKTRHAWVCWQIETRDGKPTKIPYTPTTGKRAKSNDSATWVDFPTACEHASRFAGLGIMFSDGLCGVDLDGCRDPQTGSLQPWAQTGVAELGSYTEASPSGTGVHVLLLADLPPGRRRKGHVEVYGPGSPRYFTMTGHHLAGTPTTVEDRTPQLAAFHRRVFGEQRTDEGRPTRATAPVDLADEALLAKARAANNGAAFSQLWAGGYPEDDSAGDIALCNHLAFWTGGDPPRMDRMFRASGRMRAKWERADYREMTIRRALQTVSRSYSGTPASGSSSQLVRVSRQLIDAPDTPKEVKLLGALITASGQQVTDEELAAATKRSTRTIRKLRGKLREAGLEQAVLEAPEACYASVPRALLFDTRLSVGARVTALVIAGTMTQGTSRAGQQALARLRETGHRQVVGRHVQDLEKRGYLAVQRSSFVGQVGRRGSCNRYMWLRCSESCVGQE